MPNRPPTHRPRKAPGEPRPSAAARGYDAQWRRFRAIYLRNHPLCAECLKHQRAEPACHVDHKLALEKGGAKYDEANLQPLCHSCHSAKTCAVDGGGFGKKYVRGPEKRG